MRPFYPGIPLQRPLLEYLQQTSPFSTKACACFERLCHEDHCTAIPNLGCLTHVVYTIIDVVVSFLVKIMHTSQTRSVFTYKHSHTMIYCITLIFPVTLYLRVYHPENIHENTFFMIILLFLTLDHYKKLLNVIFVSL